MADYRGVYGGYVATPNRPEGPRIEDFDGFRGRPPQSLTVWLRALPCDTPTQVPADVLGERSADDLRAFVFGAYGRQRGVGSVRKWPDGTVWVLRRSVPKPRVPRE